MFLKSRRIWKCRATDCRKQFSVKVGTVLNESPIPIEKWLTAMWLVANCRNGVSSCEIARDLGLTQKTAWFMLHRIREAMQDKTATKLAGEVEVDESFIGGKSRNMHAKRRAEVITGTGGANKAIALGMVERGGNVRTFAVPNRRKHELHGKIRQHVKAGSALFSEALKSYDGLAGEYQHAVVDHAVEYVRGNVHTNTMENFWSLVKRQLHGTYISVEPFHLFRYLDEQSFRYNGRKLRCGTFLARLHAGCWTPPYVGSAYREGKVGEGSETPRAREAKTLSLWLALFLQLRRALFLRLHAHQDTGQPVEVLELRTFWLGYRDLCSRSHSSSIVLWLSYHVNLSFGSPIPFHA